MDSPTLLDHEWQALLELLPPGWEDAAQTQGAFLRKRQIADPKTLLRLIFVYVWAGLSLRNTVAWAQHKRIATLSDVALLERLQRAQDWLAWMVAKVLSSRAE